MSCCLESCVLYAIALCIQTVLYLLLAYIIPSLALYIYDKTHINVYT